MILGNDEGSTGVDTYITFGHAHHLNALFGYRGVDGDGLLAQIQRGGIVDGIQLDDRDGAQRARRAGQLTHCLTGDHGAVGIFVSGKLEAVAVAFDPVIATVDGVLPGGAGYQAAHLDGAVAGDAIAIDTGIVGQRQGRCRRQFGHRIQLDAGAGGQLVAVVIGRHGVDGQRTIGQAADVDIRHAEVTVFIHGGGRGDAVAVLVGDGDRHLTAFGDIGAGTVDVHADIGRAERSVDGQVRVQRIQLDAGAGGQLVAVVIGRHGVDGQRTIGQAADVDIRHAEVTVFIHGGGRGDAVAVLVGDGDRHLTAFGHIGAGTVDVHAGGVVVDLSVDGQVRVRATQSDAGAGGQLVAVVIGRHGVDGQRTIGQAADVDIRHAVVTVFIRGGGRGDAVAVLVGDGDRHLTAFGHIGAGTVDVHAGGVVVDLSVDGQVRVQRIQLDAGAGGQLVAVVIGRHGVDGQRTIGQAADVDIRHAEVTVFIHGRRPADAVAVLVGDGDRHLTAFGHIGAGTVDVHAGGVVVDLSVDGQVRVQRVQLY